MAKKKKIKTVKLDLMEVPDSNAFLLMGYFQRQAKKEGWTREEIGAVLDECKEGDYNHLIATLDKYCKV